MITRAGRFPRFLLTALLLALAWSGSGGGAWADPNRFKIQPDASELSFKATSRLMNADGKFHRFGGEITLDPKDLTTTKVSLSVEAASIDTHIKRRDNHLRSEDFFHVERYPAITFESLRVEPAGKRVTVFGRLSMRGVTREVAVPVEVVELTEGALLARGAFDINRNDYGISYQSFLNPIGYTVRIAFTFRARAS